MDKHNTVMALEIDEDESVCIVWLPNTEVIDGERRASAEGAMIMILPNRECPSINAVTENRATHASPGGSHFLMVKKEIRGIITYRSIVCIRVWTMENRSFSGAVPPNTGRLICRLPTGSPH